MQAYCGNDVTDFMWPHPEHEAHFQLHPVSVCLSVRLSVCPSVRLCHVWPHLRNKQPALDGL